jgi:3-hydroxyisobutyrate dehydrogenase-like beta-hydroxyacid dehydrogenase
MGAGSGADRGHAENPAMTHNTPRLCFIGFGEAGQAFAVGLRGAGVTTMAAWDILFPEAAGARLRSAGEQIGVRLGSSAGEAIKGADIVIAAVTAASSLEAAQQAKPHLNAEQFYLDINSVSPGRKQATAKHLAGGARYVDVAVMAPVHPARHQTPVLLAGPHAQAIESLMQELGMKPSIAGPEVGQAAAIKMVRSVMIKGMEALTQECFLAATRAGVGPQIIASLSKSFPGLDWSRTVAYNLERMANHGTRRAAEMEEVADTLRELGIDPHMANATVARQRQMGALGKSEDVQAAIAQGGTATLQAISAALSATERTH